MELLGQIHAKMTTEPAIHRSPLHSSLTEPLPVLAPHSRLDDCLQIGPREGKHWSSRRRTRIRGRRITGWPCRDATGFRNDLASRIMLFTLLTWGMSWWSIKFSPMRPASYMPLAWGCPHKLSAGSAEIEFAPQCFRFREQTSFALGAYPRSEVAMTRLQSSKVRLYIF